MPRMDRRPTTAPSPHTTLVGPRIRLEPLRPEHEEALARHALDPRLWAFTQQRLLSREALREYLAKALAERDQGVAVPFVG